MRAIHPTQDPRNTIPGYLGPYGGRDERPSAQFPVIPQAVGLNAGDVMFLKTRRQRIFAKQQLVRTINILNSSPSVVMLQETEGRFEQITVPDISVHQALVPSPDQCRR